LATLNPSKIRLFTLPCDVKALESEWDIENGEKDVLLGTTLFLIILLLLFPEKKITLYSKYGLSPKNQLERKSSRVHLHNI